jgi:predicted component of type VI protein secretion system
MDPMTVNTEGEQRKREAETPPSSTKKKKKKGSKSELLEIGDNPEEAYEPKGPAGRPKGSAKSSSSSSSSAAAAPAASSSSASAGSQQVPIKKTVDKPHGVKKDTSKSKNYWKRQNIQYLYEQLQLDGMRFTAMQKTGKEDVLDPALGRKVQKKGDKLVKNDLLEMLYKSRNII